MLYVYVNHAISFSFFDNPKSRGSSRVHPVWWCHVLNLKLVERHLSNEVKFSLNHNCY